MNQTQDPACVSATTYLDLSSMSFDQFQDQLNSIHGQLQHVASGGSDDNYWTFAGIQWWYAIVCLPESETTANRLWRRLASEEIYNFMIDAFLRDESTNSHIKLTNNLQFIDSEMALPTSQYPTMQVHQDEARSEQGQLEVPVFPMTFILSPSSTVSFPPQSYNPPINPDRRYQYHPLSYDQLRKFDFGYPPGITLQSPRSISNSSFCVHNTPDGSEYAPGSLSAHLKPPASYSHGDMTINVPQSYTDTQSSLITPSTFMTSDNSLPSARLPLTPATTINAHPGIDTEVSIPLYTRPAPSLGRRYSVPGDSYTIHHGEPICSDDLVVWVNAADSLKKEECRSKLGIKGRGHSRDQVYREVTTK